MKTKQLTALQLLNELERSRKIEKYPTVPEYALALTKYSDKNTNGLTRCVIDLLRFNNCHVERTGNEGRVIDQRQTVTNVIGQVRTIGSLKRIYSTGTRGTSDLKACINGKMICIEIKNKNTHDKQSEAQRNYQKAVEASGAVYIIVTDFKSFYGWFTDFIKKGLCNAK